MNTTRKSLSSYPGDLGKNTSTPKHLTIPTYAPFSPYYRLNLQENAYKARDLLNATVAAFHKRNMEDLSRRQNYARDKFCALFSQRQEKYGQVVHDFPKSLSLSAHDVTYLAEQLDRFFFFGLVMDYVELVVYSEKTETDPPRTFSGVEGDMSRCNRRNRQGEIRIAVNIGSYVDGSLGSLNSIVGQLVHEMVHAYLKIFACDCWKCERDSLNTVGVANDGHGPIFLTLHRLILSEIRKWPADLKGLLSDDCPGDRISKSSFARGMAAMKSLSEQKRGMLNPLRSTNFTKNYLVRFNTNSTRVLVDPTLVTRQLHKEAMLKSNRKIQKLKEDWNLKVKEEEEDEYSTDSESTDNERTESEVYSEETTDSESTSSEDDSPTGTGVSLPCDLNHVTDQD